MAVVWVLSERAVFYWPGHATLNLGPRFITHLNGRTPRELFMNIHYSATGNAVVASAVAEALARVRGNASSP